MSKQMKVHSEKLHKGGGNKIRNGTCSKHRMSSEGNIGSYIVAFWFIIVFIHFCVGLVKVVRQLLSLGADVNWQDRNGRSALTHACILGNTDIMRELIQAGANLYQVSNVTQAENFLVQHYMVKVNFNQLVVALKIQQNME